MFEDKSYEEILEELLTFIPDDYDKSEGSIIWDALNPVAVKLAEERLNTNNNFNKVFVQNATGNYLDLRAAEQGLTREQGTKATGTITFTGSNNVIIPSNTIVQSINGLKYYTSTDVTITNGSVDVIVIAEKIGIIYNVPSNTITQLPVAINGITLLTNTNIISGGTEIESDEALRKRYYLKAQSPSASGNTNDYKNWALSVNGIGGAKILPLWNGNGTVKVVVIDANKTPATSTLVTNVTNFIESVRPVGATVTVISATGLSINVACTITKDSNYTSQQVLTNITNNLTKYLQGIAFINTYVSYAQIGNAILDSAGVIDYNNLTINSGTSNISIGNEQVAILGSVTV